MLGWYKEDFLGDYLMNSSYILLLIIDGMILKMKKFVIEWRKFEFKRSSIFKVIKF